MIIIPTYNERKNIAFLVGRIRQFLPQVDILFIDDNSPDGTAEEIKKIQDPNIHLIVRPSKAGFASAYLDGFQFALKMNPEFIITMDADLSHPVERIPELINLVKEGKVAIGSRYVKDGQIKNWSLKRRLLSRLGNWYARFFLRIPVKDLTSGFNAIPIEKIRQLDLPIIQNQGYAFMMELKKKLYELDAELIEIPITFEERKEDESKLTGNIIIEALKYPIREYLIRQIKLNYPAWLIFFISFFTYLATLPKTIFFGDSSEFIASVATLGIPHPPGYPAYILLAKLFTFLPFGNLEFRIGIFSSLCASLTLVIFYFLFLRIGNKLSENQTIAKIVAMGSSFVLAFSSLFWSQAIMAKVYAPALLILLIIFLLLIKFWESSKPSYFVWSMFLFGLGSGMHQMLLLFLPILIVVGLLYIFKQQNLRSYRFDVRPFLLGIGLFILGVSIYSFLYLRSGMPGNYFDFSKIFRVSPALDNFSGFINYVLRTEYNDYGGKFVWDDKLNYLFSFSSNLNEQFYGFGILALIGLAGLFLKTKKFFLFTLSAFFINVFGIIFLRSSGWSVEQEFLYSFYYLPAYNMVALLIGFGLITILDWLKKIPAQILIGSSLIIFLIPIFLFWKNINTRNLSEFTFVHDYTQAILESMEPNAILLTHYTGASTDTMIFSLKYQKLVKKIRPDVALITTFDIYPEVERKFVHYFYGLDDDSKARYYLINYVLKNPTYNNRPIYSTFMIHDSFRNEPWYGLSNGLVYKFYPELNKGINNLYYEIDLTRDLEILKSDLFGRDLLAQYHYAQGTYWVAQNDLSKAQVNFENATRYDYKVTGLDQKTFVNNRNRLIKNQ